MRKTRFLVVLLLSFLGSVGVLTSVSADALTRFEGIVVVGKRIPTDTLPDLTYDEIQNRLTYARLLLENHTLPIYTVEDKKRGVRWLRGRPVTYAAQSAQDRSWHLVTIEMPLPAKQWVQGKPYPYFKVLTPGYSAEHLRGTGENILMFRLYKGDERLYVYGRKYPDLDNALYTTKGKYKGSRAHGVTKYEELLAKTSISYHLPFTPDILYPSLISRGRLLLEQSAERALTELRNLNITSFAYPEQTVGDTIQPETIVVLALNEQMDHFLYRQDRRSLIDEVFNQYGLHGEQAYEVTVSNKKAVGPMQFTNNPSYKTVLKKGKKVRVKRSDGTYSMVQRACADAQLLPFPEGARDLKNSMKAAACLLDMELKALSRESVLKAYREHPLEMGVFPVAAYNGGQDDAARLYRWIVKKRIIPSHIRSTTITTSTLPSSCPCLWIEDDRDGRMREIPLKGLNEENRWYVEKYLFVLSVLYAQ